MILIVKADDMPIDPLGACNTNSTTISYTTSTTEQGKQITLNCKMTYIPIPAGCKQTNGINWVTFAMNSSSGNYALIPSTNSGNISCSGDNCYITYPANNTYYSKYITSNFIENYLVACKSGSEFSQNVTLSFTASSSPVITLNKPSENNITESNINWFNCSALDSLETDNLTFSIWNNQTSVLLNQQSVFNKVFLNDSNTLILYDLDGSLVNQGGNNYNYTNLPTTYVNTKFEQGKIFGSNSRMEFNTTQTNGKYIVNLSEGSVEYWVKPTNNYGTTNAIVFTNYYASSDNMYMGWSGGSSTDLFMRYVRASNGNQLTTSGVSMNANQWYYVAFTWNTTDQFIYLDGVLKASKTHGGVPRYYSAITYIGDPTTSIAGTLDQFRVYNVMRTASQILTTNNTNWKYLEGNFNYNITSEGTYNWNCKAYDDDDNSAWRVFNFTIFKDLYFPQISLISPNITFYNFTGIPLLYWYNESNLDYCYYNFNNGTNSYLYSCENTSLLLANGEYYLNLSIKDKANRINSTAFHFYLVAPEIKNDWAIAQFLLLLSTGILFIWFGLESEFFNTKVPLREFPLGLGLVFFIFSLGTIKAMITIENSTVNSFANVLEIITLFLWIFIAYFTVKVLMSIIDYLLSLKVKNG